MPKSGTQQKSAFPISWGLQPQEEMLEVGKKAKKLIIGIPKETTCGETRISLTPESVKILANQGHEVIIESGAGKPTNFTDLQYSENGATIVKTSAEVFHQSDIILKVSPFSLEEINLLSGNQTIISALHINKQTPDFLKAIMQKKVTAIATEGIMDSDGCYPIMRSMNAIAGSTSILVAAELMSTTNNGKGVLLGSIPGITPAEVLIIGASTAGEFAARAALGLGAEVKIVDTSIRRLSDIQNVLGQRVFTSTFHPQVVEKIIKTADVVIATVNPEEQNPMHIDERLVKSMKQGAVVIDLAVDKGGSFATSEYKTNGDPAYVKHGVIHYCIPNITSSVGRTASIALSSIYTPLLLDIGESPSIKNYLKENIGIRNGVYVYAGILTNTYLGEIYNLPSRDIDLLMAAF